jgi:DNA polymerase III, delta subunit
MPRPFCFGTLQKKWVKSLFESFENKQTLLSEKPWERSGRRRHELAVFLKTRGRAMSPDGFEAFEVLGLDPLTQLREIEKVIAFAGERTQLTGADVSAVCLSRGEANAWRLFDYAMEGNARGFCRLVADAALDLSGLLGNDFCAPFSARSKLQT